MSPCRYISDNDPKYCHVIKKSDLCMFFYDQVLALNKVFDG